MRPGRREWAYPRHEFTLTGVGQKPTEDVNLRFDRNLLAKYAHPFHAIDQGPSDGASRLKSCNHHMGARTPQIVLQVMQLRR